MPSVFDGAPPRCRRRSDPPTVLPRMSGSGLWRHVYWEETAEKYRHLCGRFLREAAQAVVENTETFLGRRVSATGWMLNGCNNTAAAAVLKMNRAFRSGEKWSWPGRGGGMGGGAAGPGRGPGGITPERSGSEHLPALELYGVEVTPRVDPGPGGCAGTTRPEWIGAWQRTTGGGAPGGRGWGGAPQLQVVADITLSRGSG